MHGKPGERFEAFGAWFEFTAVDRIQLGDVAKLFYRQEGFECMEDFLDCWAEIHPRAKYDPAKPVWLHQFRIVDSNKLDGESCDESCRAEKWHQDVSGSRYHYCARHGLIRSCDLDEKGHDIG
jgi:hypothetical protein